MIILRRIGERVVKQTEWLVSMPEANEDSKVQKTNRERASVGQ